MSALDTEPFPRGALIAAAALISFSLVGTAAVRLSHLRAPQPSAASIRSAEVEHVDMRFADEPDGSVSIHNSDTGALIANLKPGTNGFVRGVVRGLAHDRLRRGLGSEPPFRLLETANSHLALRDTATGRVIDLEAFGSTNRQAFLALLHPDSVAS